MLYEPSMYAKLLGIKTRSEISIEIKISVELYVGQRIMILDPIQTGVSPNFNIAVPIAIRGHSAGLQTTTVEDEITHTIMDSVAAATIQNVITAVDDDVYTIDATTYLGGETNSSNSGTITKNSDIEIL